ncbi:MAG TPA: TSUP family transporter [Candidatus Binataceae bacterium]
MFDIIIVLVLGLAAGILGGFFGVGGGVLIVPALVLILAMDQHTAVGTSLGALLPPVGLLGAYEYYKHGHLNVTYALLLGIGLLIGAYFGARIAVQLSGLALRRAFAIFMIIVSIRMLMR